MPLDFKLNDAIDACVNRAAQQRLFKTFTKDEQTIVIDEHARRTEDRIAPIGSLVCPLNTNRGISIVARPHPGSTTYATFYGLAVVGQPAHGSSVRLLWLPKPWENREGMLIHWAETSSYDLRVLSL